MCDYEKTCLGEFAGQGEASYVFADKSNEDVAKAALKIRDNATEQSFELLYDLVRAEHKEINVININKSEDELLKRHYENKYQAFIEAVQQREKYEQLKFKLQDKQRSDTAELQKLLAGKTTFKSLLSRKSKDEDVSNVEKQIAQTTKDIESVGMIVDMITMILGHMEIDKFKKEKVANYFKMMAQLAKAEEIAVADFQVYWDALLTNKNLQKEK